MRCEYVRFPYRDSVLRSEGRSGKQRASHPPAPWKIDRLVMCRFLDLGTRPVASLVPFNCDIAARREMTEDIGRKLKGRLAEAKVLSYCVENEWEVFTPFCDNGPYDMIVIKDDGKPMKVSIKYTSEQAVSGAWIVSLRTMSRRKNSVAVTPFNPDDIDILAVYVGPEDRVIWKEVDFTNTNSISLH